MLSPVGLGGGWVNDGFICKGGRLLRHTKKIPFSLAQYLCGRKENCLKPGARNDQDLHHANLFFYYCKR